MLRLRNGRLACEEVPLDAIAEAVGTPAYVYSSASVRSQFARLDQALSGVPHRIHYSLKANGNSALLRLIRSLGGGADVVSGGELYRALHGGFAPEDIVFGGVGKSARELVEAVEAGVRLVNVESEAELRLLDGIAGERRRRMPVGLRLNPEITVDNPHAYIRTGGKGHKFGIPWDEGVAAARLAASLPWIELAGLDMHVGSQLAELDAYQRGLERIVSLMEAIRGEGIQSLRYLDIGGGLAVPYEHERPPDLRAYGRIVREAARRTGLEVLVEPGRFLVAEAGTLLTRVLYRKRSGGREIAVTDAGMTELLRPSHYQAYHHIDPVRPRQRAAVRIDVVGPVCESGDFLALDREMPDIEAGDLLAVRTAGAYGYSMASNYNARPRAAEVLVDGDRYAVTTEREEYADLIRLERHALDWRTA
ncbi:MAG: diaminopimelate decarboxylase [Gemmatimonadaceae bacterium]|nr:diaminopimelate decarboxylase [Gemmatimonadaceae bacterium]